MNQIFDVRWSESKGYFETLVRIHYDEEEWQPLATYLVKYMMVPAPNLHISLDEALRQEGWSDPEATKQMQEAIRYSTPFLD